MDRTVVHAAIRESVERLLSKCKVEWNCPNPADWHVWKALERLDIAEILLGGYLDQNCLDDLITDLESDVREELRRRAIWEGEDRRA